MGLFDGTLGAAFVGMVAAAILYGVTSVQAFMYFHDFKQDSKKTKAMVLVLWILDTIHLAFTCHAVYYYLVTNFGNFGAFSKPTWSIIAQVYLTCLSDVIVRGFFARRVFVLCGPRKILAWALSITIVTLALVVFALAFGFASEAFVLKTYQKLSEASALMYSSSLGSIAVDTIIAASLCTLLLMSRTGTRKTNSVITLLMAFSINTGLLTSIVTLASFIAYAVWPQRFVFMGIYFTISKLYINSVLASLNARTAIRSAEESDFDMSFGMTTTNRRVHTDIAFPKRGEISSQPGISESEPSIPELEISESKEFGSATGSESISV